MMSRSFFHWGRLEILGKTCISEKTASSNVKQNFINIRFRFHQNSLRFCANFDVISVVSASFFHLGGRYFLGKTCISEKTASSDTKLCFASNFASFSIYFLSGFHQNSHRFSSKFTLFVMLSALFFHYGRLCFFIQVHFVFSVIFNGAPSLTKEPLMQKANPRDDWKRAPGMIEKEPPGWLKRRPRVDWKRAPGMIENDPPGWLKTIPGLIEN